MRLLLDSCAIVWWLRDPSLLHAEARAAISDPDNDVFFSAASVWELGLKIAARRIEMPGDFADALRAEAIEELEIRVAHAERSIELPPHHKDPFDRMLIAQAMMENLVFVTRDHRIPEYEFPVLRC